jgi:soluble lytic murein transglycosylase
LAIPVGVGIYFANQFWIHRYDDLIARHAKVYRLDDRLVWSVIYQETWFRSWKIGEAGEVGLMQITPTVAREWAKETGMKDLEKQVSDDFVNSLKEPERNIQIGCWYLEKLHEKYRDSEAKDAMMLAAYNAGPSRVEEWTKDTKSLTEAEFTQRINIPSTKNYVTEILERFKANQ